MTNTPHYAARRILQHGFQLCTLVFGKIGLQPFTRVDTSAVKPELIKKQPYIIVGNHRRGPDPFVICSGMPAKALLKITPVSFMTKNIFYDSPLRPFLWLSGGYPARNPKSKHNLYGVDASIQLLQHGFSVFIFPEGKRVYDKQRGEAHWGIVRVHKAMPHIPMILCHIEYNKGLRAWLAGNRRSVKYRVVEHPNYDDPEKIMDDIYVL